MRQLVILLMLLTGTISGDAMQTRLRWTDAQDNLLQDKVAENGEKWDIISLAFDKKKSPRQCHDRFIQLSSRLPWTEDEDQSLIYWGVRHNLYGQWAKLANALGTGRSDSEVKNRYKKLKKEGVWVGDDVHNTYMILDMVKKRKEAEAIIDTAAELNVEDKDTSSAFSETKSLESQRRLFPPTSDLISEIISPAEVKDVEAFWSKFQ